MQIRLSPGYDVFMRTLGELVRFLPSRKLLGIIVEVDPNGDVRVLYPGGHTVRYTSRQCNLYLLEAKYVR